MNECGGRALCFRNKNTQGMDLSPKTKTNQAKEAGRALAKEINKRSSNYSSNFNDQLLILKDELDALKAQVITHQNNGVAVSNTSGELRTILDSGSSGHFSPNATNVDVTCQIVVAGFNGSTERTNGVGELDEP